MTHPTGERLDSRATRSGPPPPPRHHPPAHSNANSVSYRFAPNENTSHEISAVINGRNETCSSRSEQRVLCSYMTLPGIEEFRFEAAIDLSKIWGEHCFGSSPISNLMRHFRREGKILEKQGGYLFWVDKRINRCQADEFVASGVGRGMARGCCRESRWVGAAGISDQSRNPSGFHSVTLVLFCGTCTCCNVCWSRRCSHGDPSGCLVKENGLYTQDSSFVMAALWIAHAL